MQYRPDASELLSDVAALLEGEVLGAVTGPLQHRVRVAANLLRIVEREIGLGGVGDTNERARLVALVDAAGVDDTSVDDTSVDDTSVDDTSVDDTSTGLVELRRRLAARLDDPAPLSAGESQAIYDALQATVRADLAISKPGYDDWRGQ